MKTILILLTPILVGIIIYMISAFIGGDWNVINYSKLVRFFIVMMWIAASAFGIIGVMYNEKDNK